MTQEEFELDDIATEFQLTPGEMRVASVIARGIGGKAAARELGLAHNTIRKYLQNIFVKTGVRTQGALVVLFLTTRKVMQ